MSNVALHLRLVTAGPPTSETVGTSVQGEIVFGDNLDFLRALPSSSIDLIYIDPPFNTGRVQVRRQLRRSAMTRHPTVSDSRATVTALG